MTDEPHRSMRAEEIEAIRKEEVVDTYTALIDKIWQRALTILGLFTTRVIMQRAIRMTLRQYPLIGELIIGDDGLQTSSLHAHINEENREVIRQGFEELILNLFDLLTELIGETIVNKLFAEELSTGQLRRSEPEP